MYHKIDDFLSDWKYESEMTLKLMKNLTDESLTKKVSENVRTIGYLTWHLIHTMQEMMALTGLDVDVKKQTDYNGETARELYMWYEKGAASLAKEVKSKWTDADLYKEDNMYGGMWKRGTTLQILVRHQSHHRGELVVLMRILGLPVIGVYGPAKEEWKMMGMEAMN